MEVDNDPFPPSLPQYDGTRILGDNMDDSMEDGALNFASMNFESPESTAFSNESNYQSSTKPNKNPPARNTSTIGNRPYSQSPESSPESSSSDSSPIQYLRHHSSDSSQLGMLIGHGDIQMTGYMPVQNDIGIGVDPVEFQANDESLNVTDVDESNREMACHFDFDSAASSPGVFSGSKLGINHSIPARPIQMPFRNTQRAGFGHGFGPYARVSKGTRENSPQTSMPMMKNQSSWPPTTGYMSQPPINFSNQYVNGALLNGTSQASDWQYHGTAEPAADINLSQNPIFQQPAMAMPFASPAPTSVPPYPPRLYIGALPAKSRVETQIPIRLILYPPPQGIARLHLQTYTISKSKLVAKPPPEKAPDMLELCAMLVCTSAMQDPEKRERAFAKATEFQYGIKKEGRRSSSGDATPPEDEESKPLNGGPVQICAGCIERERKRAARKKTKNVEEEQLWQKDEDKRIIVFNTQEIKDWQPPSHIKNGDNSQSNSPFGDMNFPETALQVDIPMRIACYCRHQEEKLGFQVIFTIKDHEDKVIAQEMTNSIIITDDHKTHVPPGIYAHQTAILPDGPQYPGAGVFQQAPNGAQGPTPFRHAYSTTDLPGMQQYFNGQQINAFAIPQNASQTTSATLTPKTLSRQASPSAPSGQQSKKRKASASGRIRNDLAMTKLQTIDAPAVMDPGVSPSTQTVGPGPGATPAYSTNYASPNGTQITPPINTGKPTPNTGDSRFYSSAQRSQSMENLQGYQAMFSAPSSVRPSRAPSPAALYQNNGLPQAPAQKVTSALHPILGAAQSQPLPVIHKLTPGEGSKSGGIEVTCLGSGFHRGLEVMFGDALATTTTFWGESALVCLLPPAIQAGTVSVTFKHNYHQRMPSPTKKDAQFRYVDDDEEEIMKHALSLLNRKWNGNATDPCDTARQIISRYEGNVSLMGGTNHGGSQQQQMHGSNATTPATVDLETAMLSCLELVDLDDSPYQAGINAQGPGGQSMLHFSASLGYYRLVAGLLARGANPDLRDNNGMSPMHMASLRGNSQIIRKLRSAGGDPSLRSLNGFTPADMASLPQVRDASNAVDHRHRRSKSAGATPVSHLSRSSSIRSVKSFRGVPLRMSSAGAGSNFVGLGESGDEDLPGRYISQPATPAQAWARSRRNSLITEQQLSNEQSTDGLAPHASLFAANPAMSAWRDQLLAHIQQLQQSLHRTLPNLQIPALPPMPNLPDYQAHPVVRRISSLVPQRNARPSPPDSNSNTPEYRWWELFSGQSSLPPPYEEIYPEKSQPGLSDKKASNLLAAGEAFMDQKCEIAFDQVGESPVVETVNTGSASLTRQQREQLRNDHARKVKKLRSDRNLFFIWLPLLFFVLVMMLKDRIPQALNVAGQMFRYAQDHFRERVVEVV